MKASGIQTPLLRLASLVIFFLTLNVQVAAGATAIIRDCSFYSDVFSETRYYRIFLPPDYETSGKRYPVVYWFHGWSERYNKVTDDKGHRNYDVGTDYGGDNIASFVGTHDLIVVKWDGYNPRTPGEVNLRPYNIGPVVTYRQFPLYFPELVHYIDSFYRTIPDREHRGTSGLSMGGFMSLWIGGKYPDMLGSVSDFMGAPEFVIGPHDFPVEYRHDEMHNNYDGVMTRIVMGTQDFIQFYHRRMNVIWDFTRAHHESETFESEHGTPGMTKTMAFHMQAFAHPLARPAVWNHIDVYPAFSVWGWDVVTDRAEPGFTVLENVSRTGFRSSVRDWVPVGRTLTAVQVRIKTAPLYRPNEEETVTVIRLREGEVHRLHEKTDAQGQLHLELDGDEYEVGIGSGPVLALTGYRIEGAEWATDTQPVRVQVRFLNKGDRSSPAMRLQWETSNPDVQLDTASVTLPPLGPGKSVEVPFGFTISDSTREMFKAFAVAGQLRLPVEIPTFPPAEKTSDFRIADGEPLSGYQHAVQKQTVTLGTGNGDGQANPGEQIAIMLADGDAYRPAYVYTNDVCVDLTKQGRERWGGYEPIGNSVHYSLPLIKTTCAPGHVIHMVARVQLPDKPNHKVRFAVVEFKVQ